MEKIDFKKIYKELYSASASKVAIVNVSNFNYLSVDGEGNPNESAQFTNAIEALYGLSYTIKFSIKKASGSDFGVMPLEGLWWCNDMEQFSVDRKDDWKWTAMVMQPELVTKEIFEKALIEVKTRKNLAAIDKVRFKNVNDGLSAQILHVGPYADEGPTIQRLHQFIDENGYVKTGKHREIYLSDMRKTAPSKLKTIIRQPIQKK